ncbi:tuberin [Teleopsis dalmanni]|uniref:tuberin n=1 Tax=Teleopsis dalmanni TaxID=139649 RepID=UPI0018CDCB73|nr:tuberin [Teleopsis dalmanni]
MSSKSKLKSFVKMSKSPAGSNKERSLPTRIEEDLKPENPAAQRCKTLKDFGESQLINLHLDEASITKLWDLTKDLIVPNKSAECRQTVLTFYKKLIFSQYKSLTLMREHFFLVIQNHEVQEDLKHCLELLDTLTENGKDITNFEEKIGKFMLHWIPAITDANLLRPYLEMLVNLIKFNAAHLDNDIVIGIVQNACHLSCTVEGNEIGLQCLTILELVMGYTIFPSDPLPLCVATLCRTVNHIPYCQASWKIMKNLLGTQLGYNAMKMMCNILNDRSLYEDQQLLRGAVFHLNMNIFGSNLIFQVPTMFYATTVLTSFLHALESRQVIVTFEVILSARKVINKYKTELPEIIWDRICDIMFAIVDNIEYYQQININQERLQYLQANFHENIDCIEKLLQEDRSQILANLDRIYDLIERVSDGRHEASVLSLIEYRALKVTATRPQWLHVLNDFVNRFYKMPNTNIRIRTIQALVRIMDMNRFSYEEEILERVVIPHFSHIMHEADVHIRVAVANALVNFASHCDTKRCGELLDILEKLINRPFELHSGLAEGDFYVKSEADILDVIAAVDGLIDVFIIKLYRLPSYHAIKIFNILIGHLESHYERPKIFEQTNIVRYKIFNWMLKARANASFHIGYPDPANNDLVTFSCYLGIDSSLPLYGMTHQHQRHQVVSQLTTHEIVSSTHFTTISIRRACKIIVKCLEHDRDFEVFKLVIRKLPQVLQNKALIQGNDIEALAVALFKLCPESNKSLHFSYKPNTDEFRSLILPAIASLVLYHQFIQPGHQSTIISVLIQGIVPSMASVSLNAMTIMVLEMPEALMRRLPEILLQMSKMSDTISVAIPVLEFLSILSRLSNHLFTNFTPRQYMYVFAISLPYTKPYKYDHYAVSLAHHVIAGWFVKCKLELRKNFVHYIISSIQSNANMLFDDIKRNVQRQDFNTLNEDSSNRKRSTSLTERGSRIPNIRNDSDMRPRMNDSLKSFHAELTETCIDFLAQHTFSPCSALPKRLPAIEYILKDGLSQTWLVGHNLVTITTSGCPSAPLRNGLCERCAQLGKVTSLPANDNTITSDQYALDRRYTKVSLQHSSGNESAGSTDLTSSSSSTSAATNTATTQRQTSNSSSASLEALSRRGSNPETTDIGVGGSSTSLLGNSFSTTSVSASPTQMPSVQQQVCIRSCTGWAEILVRRPTGNISWITRIQNPIANDCFGQDIPLNNMISLFLPVIQGGVFGPDVRVPHNSLLDEETTQPEPVVQIPTASTASISRESLTTKTSIEDQRPFNKARALQRQEEISSSTTVGTAAIDIPKPTGKRGKDALSGSVSDGEAEDDSTAFEDATSRARNPVRRVNSSPEMSSSWRQTFLASKPTPLSQQILDADIIRADLSSNELQQQKKKSVQYTKDMRVSCEAIPEEIAGSTPPQTAQTADSKKETETSTKMLETTNSLPPKQHSADDVSSANAQAVQQSASASSLRSHAVEMVTSKPPVSPAPPLSPRLDKHGAQKTASFTSHQGLAKSSSSGGGPIGGGVSGTPVNSSDYGGDMMRGRSKTISVVREVNGKTRPATSFRSLGGPKQPPNTKLCMSPSFIFMQLFHTGQMDTTDMPLKVTPEHMSKLTVLDLLPPFERHKIGVLYVGQGQCNNVVEILRNSYGSTRYVEFLRGIGTLVSLKEAEQNNLFIGLDTGGADGKFTYVWKDDIVQVTFHVATLMPTNLKKDPNCNEKKKHIGNDFVHIIYNESGKEYKLNTISGQFSYACVIVEPLELNTNRIYVKAREEICKLVCHPEPKIVSDRSAPLLARQMALHANLASHVYQSLKKEKPYASNWLERLRCIKRLRGLLIENQNSSHQSGPSGAGNEEQPGDFTKYT